MALAGAQSARLWGMKAGFFCQQYVRTQFGIFTL